MPTDSHIGQPARNVLAFDVYGTLVDPIAISRALERVAPADAVRTAEVWRQKQLEYSFRLTVMEQYQDFEWVTARAFEYALAVTGVVLDEPQRAAILAQYDSLAPFPEVEAGLKALRAAGIPMVVFSNGSPRMLQAVLASSGLAGYFSEMVSVDEVRAFKPSPRAYRHLATRVGCAPEQVRLISSNPFDIIGALAVGLKAAWVNRAGAPFDTLTPPPPLTITGLTELAAALGA
jgi:2-haloacid dehalogenase